MKLLIVGDFKNNTGPANVNKTMKFLDKTIDITIETGKFKRVFELLGKLVKVDFVVFSGLSNLNLIGFKLAKIFNKKAAYLMHGYSKYENEIEGIVDEKSIQKEIKVLENAPMIICVSKLFMEHMKKLHPEYSHKLKYLMNPINSDAFFEVKDNIREENLIMSVGGGKRRKNILNICKAIELINSKSDIKYKFIVIGSNEIDSEKIKAFNFVEYIENVEYKDMCKYYSRCKLYIQNSSFETFGLAPIEALMCGANILISNAIGCKDVLRVKENDIIFCTNDIKEISKKILINMGSNNNTYLKSSIEYKKFNKFSLINVMGEVE